MAEIYHLFGDTNASEAPRDVEPDQEWGNLWFEFIRAKCEFDVDPTLDNLRKRNRAYEAFYGYNLTFGGPAPDEST